MSVKFLILAFLVLGSGGCGLNPEEKYLLNVPRHSELETYLYSMPETATFIKSNHLWSKVEISSPTSEVRDEIANLAHKSGGGCGQIVPKLALTTLASVTNYSKPVYDTAVFISEVRALFDKVSESRIQATIQELVAMKTRHHASTSGKNVPSWISAKLAGWTVSLESHATTDQKSVIARLASPSPIDSKKIILGAHLDSINSSDLSNAPGADDNASGIAVLLEIAYLITQENLKFSRNIELHFYAAEEVGLVGSNEIAKASLARSDAIAGMMQFDMTGYLADGKTIDLVTTDTSSWMRRHLLDLGAVYFDEKWTESNLSAGTSDHRSWSARGFHAAFPFEHVSRFNQKLHTSSDTLDNISVSSVAKFAKLGLGFTAHYAGFTSSASYSEAYSQLQKSIGSDLKAAVINKDGLKYIALSTATDFTGVETCLAEANTEICSADRVLYTRELTRDGRHFFISDSAVAVAPGQVLLFKAYAGNGLFKARRTVTITE